jgi:hypothetical protein
MLANSGARSQTSGIMKTLSGTFAFVVLAVIAIVTLPSCSRKQITEADECRTDKKLLLKFGKKVQTHPPEYEYVEVNKDAFDKALCALKANHGHFKVGFKADAAATPIDPYDPTCPTASINTDKITTSGVARTEPAEESAAYDPNVVYRVNSNSLKDIKDVLNSFEEPTPTPTP